MKVRKLISVSAGTLLLVTSITPILADEVSVMNTDMVTQICQDQIKESSNIIHQYLDGIQIEKEETVQAPIVNNEITYVYVEQPVYVDQPSVNVEELLVEFEESADDTAYQQALDAYNTALAEYEAASQMIETTKEIEVEIVEEVTDDQGNINEVTRTEIQTVTEVVPAGDVELAQANLDAAKAALDTVAVIDEEITHIEPVTSAESGSCGENLTYTLDDNGQLTISGSGAMDDRYRPGWQETVNSIVLNEGITTLGKYAFYGCKNITEAVIPVGVTDITYAAFYQCTGLTSVTIPYTVTSIGEYAFTWDENLTDVYYQGSQEDWEAKNMYEFSKNTTIHFIGKPFPFKDVTESDWYYNTADECYQTGLINGTSATTFSPMQTMTRAMVVTILWRMEGQPTVAFNNKFSDVSSRQWYANSISWAETAGVVHGYGDGTFKPDAAVTREQVAVMLANYAQYKNTYKPGTKKLNTFPDGSQVSTYAQAGMKWALTNGIISGNGEGYLRPKKSATRAEGATMILRMNHWLEDNDPIRVAAKKGMVGFVEWMVEKGYANGEGDASVIELLNDNLTLYNTNAKSKNSPFNLDNAVASIASMKQCNDLRALHNLNPLRVNNYLMLVAGIQNCASWDLYLQDKWDHSRIYNVGENIAVGYEDPFEGWYYEEKAMADAGETEGIGHYLNIITEDYITTGFSWGFTRHSNQVFSKSDTGASFTPDEYLNLLNQYRSEMGI